MSYLALGFTYGFFVFCLVLGWIAAGMLDLDGILRRSGARWGRFLLRLGVALVLAEGFRVFLSYALGPLVEILVNRSVTGFKTF
ncbi:Hypothetical protein DEACI_1345 [Acididesulfobacillus acetoxydans]|uniref:Uncharacterized protein n=1 Tax=Acididesulfobacillus acetoxydans TaxID=1561005 RepID=A0A8S0WF57_9FIRM|nr:hypothetical protein [Acididesulfobacillus acetoxydans]CAA7600692.1 Hypothetical protein DEACI_1345 [Acididesulfobacillus acetoxydans]CEJ09473.1 Hypothetical protein DEACI_3957 [Acididesulfobacillus acetoxydans]